MAAGAGQQLCTTCGWAKISEEKGQHKQRSHTCGLPWQEFFRNPSHWCDNRTATVGSAYPDFTHNFSKQVLWMDSRLNPRWVCEELQSIELRTSSSHVPHVGPLAQMETAILPNIDAAAFVASLRVCAKNKDLQKGSRIHDNILKRGLLEKCSDALVTMYAKCGALSKAKELLLVHKSRDVFSWTSLIAGYTQNGQGQDAFECFEQMKRAGIFPDAVTFAAILKACGSIRAADRGKQVHDEIARQGLLEKDMVLGNALVDMYAKCGDLTKAHQLLEEIPSCRNVFSWNSLIIGYVQQGQAQQAFDCFESMQREGLSPNAVTFTWLLKACSSIGAADKGERIHNTISKRGLLRNNIVLGTALVDTYAKCGVLAKAQQVLEELPFRDVVAWNALIAGYAQHGQGGQALRCYEEMEREGLSPSAITFTCVLKACGSIKAMDKGRQIHDEIVKQGLLRNDVALGNALVDMYVKCGALSKAHQALKGIPFRNVTFWNALIAGYAQSCEGEKALKCFEEMQREGHSADAVTFSSLLKACGTMGAIDKGKEIHDEISRQGLLRDDLVLGNALVDMYAKCGALDKAKQVLVELPSQNINSWTALITGYAQRGRGQEALDCFKQAQEKGLSPDGVTFSSLLNACSHLGLVEDGCMYFSEMMTQYGVKPGVEHYTCLIDLLGRAGHLEKAVGVIEEMPPPDDFAVWSALLSACWKWRDVGVGRWAFEQAVQANRSDMSAYVLMANIYAAAGMQEEAQGIEALRMGNKA